jgi:hypothetical protein
MSLSPSPFGWWCVFVTLRFELTINILNDTYSGIALLYLVLRHSTFRLHSFIVSSKLSSKLLLCTSTRTPPTSLPISRLSIPTHPPDMQCSPRVGLSVLAQLCQGAPAVLVVKWSGVAGLLQMRLERLIPIPTMISTTNPRVPPQSSPRPSLPLHLRC